MVLTAAETLKKELYGCGCLRVVDAKRAGRSQLQIRLLGVETDGDACSGRGKERSSIVFGFQLD